MSATRDGISVDEFMNQRTLQRAIAAAEKAVIEAAKRWYAVRWTDDLDAAVRGLNALESTAPIALAVQALRELEAKGCR